MAADRTSRVRVAGIVLASALFLFSLGGNTLIYAEDSSFLLGIICLLFGQGYLPWYANLFIVFSGLFLFGQKPTWAAGAALISTALALTTLSIQEIERNEAGTMATVTGYGAGFYLWLGSNVVLLMTSLYCVAWRPKITVA